MNFKNNTRRHPIHLTKSLKNPSTQEMSGCEHRQGSETPEDLSAQSEQSKGQSDEDGCEPRCSRMDEALRLRQAMINSSSYINRKLLISQLKSPKHEVANQFDDTESDREEEEEEEEDCAGVRFEGGRKSSENLEPNQESVPRKGFCGAGMVATVGVKCPRTLRSKASGTRNSVSSKVFQDQLSARFKSTSTTARMASGDSSEE